jgi:hypothetical protein
VTRLEEALAQVAVAQAQVVEQVRRVKQAPWAGPEQQDKQARLEPRALQVRRAPPEQRARLASRRHATRKPTILTTTSITLASVAGPSSPTPTCAGN